MQFAFSDYGTRVHIQRFGFPTASFPVQPRRGPTQPPMQWAPWSKTFLEKRKVEQLLQIPHLLSNVTVRYHLHKNQLLYLTINPLPENLLKCHPSIYAYVSQVVSFHVYRLKLWTHFSSPQCVWYALHISSFLTYDTEQTIMFHMSFPPASYQFPVPLTHTLFPTPRTQVSPNSCSSLIVWDQVWNPLKTTCNITF